MIDDVFGLIFDIVVEFVPTIVWKLLFFVIGMVMTATGVTILGESTRTGSVLIAVGVVLLVGTLVSLVR
jgi:hypothetical protein